MKRGRKSAIFGLVLAITLFLPGVCQDAGAGGAVVRTEPSLISATPGQLVTVRLFAQDVTDLYGCDIQMRFDPTILEAQDAASATPGIQLQPLNTFTQPGFVIKKVLCNAPDPAQPDCSDGGFAWFVMTQLNPSPPVSGSGALAEITFRALKGGTSSLNFSYHKLADSNGMALPSIAQDGVVKVVGGVPAVRKWWVPVVD